MTRRYVPDAERNRITIHGGDGSAWLRDLHKEPEGMTNRKRIDTLRQSTGSARQQQQMNRLQHARWSHEEPGMQVSWPLAVFIAFIVIIVVVGQFGNLGTLFGASQ